MHFGSWSLEYSLAERYWYRYKNIWSVELFHLHKFCYYLYNNCFYVP